MSSHLSSIASPFFYQYWTFGKENRWWTRPTKYKYLQTPVLAGLLRATGTSAKFLSSLIAEKFLFLHIWGMKFTCPDMLCGFLPIWEVYHAVPSALWSALSFQVWKLCLARPS